MDNADVALLKVTKRNGGNDFKTVALIELKRRLDSTLTHESSLATRQALSQLLHEAVLAKNNNELLSDIMFIALGSPNTWHIFKVHIDQSFMVKDYYCLTPSADPQSYLVLITLLKEWCFTEEKLETAVTNEQ